MDPFYLRSEEESDWALDHLISQVGELSDNDIALEIVSFIAGMGDAHSFALPAAPLFERRFPAAARYYDGKLYLTACLERFEQLKPYLLHEIVAVNGVDIAHLNQKADGIVNSFNSWNSRRFAASHYFLPAFFDWAGCDYTEGYTFQILNDNREVELVEMPVVTSEEYGAGKWVYPENWKNRRVGNYAEYVDGENGRLYQWESTILPDVYVYQDVEDVRQGKDSVLEWVLAQ